MCHTLSWGWYLGYFTLCLRMVSRIFHSLSRGWYLGYFTLCPEGGIWDIALSVLRVVSGIFHSLCWGWYLGYFTLCPEGGIGIFHSLSWGWYRYVPLSVLRVVSGYSTLCPEGILIYQGVHCCTKVYNLHLDDSPSKSDNRMHWTRSNLLKWKGIYKNYEPFTDQLQPIYFTCNDL